MYGSKYIVCYLKLYYVPNFTTNYELWYLFAGPRITKASYKKSTIWVLIHTSCHMSKVIWDLRSGNKLSFVNTLVKLFFIIIFSFSKQKNLMACVYLYLFIPPLHSDGERTTPLFYCHSYWSILYCSWIVLLVPE